MWDVVIVGLVWLLYTVVLLIAVLSLVVLPALIVTSWVQRRRSRPAHR